MQEMKEINNSELEAVRATAENARITADRAHRLAKGLDDEIYRVALGLEHVDRRQHWVYRLGIAVLCLIAVTAGCAWWLNSELKAQGTSVAGLLGVQQAVSGLSVRVSGAEAGLKAFSAEWQKATDRPNAQKSASPSTTQIASAAPNPAPITDAEKPVDNRVAPPKETVAPVEAVKSEPAPETARVRSVVDRNLAAARIASLSNQTDRDRREFEISQDRALEVAPGILLSIKETNVGNQEVNGWVYLQNDHRFVYLKNQGLLEPITVWSIQQQQAHDIVITRVRKDLTRGFVLSPKSPVAMTAN